MGSSVIRRSATLAVFLALALGAPIAHAAHTPGATVTIADKRDPATFEGSGDPDVTPLVAECLPLLETLDIDALFQHTLDTMIAGLGAPPRRARRRD